MYNIVIFLLVYCCCQSFNESTSQFLHWVVVCVPCSSSSIPDLSCHSFISMHAVRYDDDELLFPCILSARMFFSFSFSSSSTSSSTQHSVTQLIFNDGVTQTGPVCFGWKKKRMTTEHVGTVRPHWLSSTLSNGMGEDVPFRISSALQILLRQKALWPHIQWMVLSCAYTNLSSCTLGFHPNILH